MRWRDTDYIEATDGSPQVQLANDQARMIRRYFIRQEDLYRAYVDFIGYSAVATLGGVKYISRFTPHAAYLPGQPLAVDPYFYAVSIPDAAGVSPKDHEELRQHARYNWLKITVVYQALTYNLLGDDDPSLVYSGGSGPLGTRPDEATLARYVTPLTKPFGRIVTLPRGIMRWVAEAGDPASAPVMEAASKSESGADVIYLHHLRPDVPRATITSLYNTVNASAFDGYAAQTLLFYGADIKPIVLPTGNKAYDIQFIFKWLPKVDKGGAARGHNWFLRFLKGSPSTYDYRRMTVSGLAGGDAPYLTADFAALFRPE